MLDEPEKIEEGSVESAKSEVVHEAPESQQTPEQLSQEDLQQAKKMVEQMHIDDDAKAQAATAATQITGAGQQEKVEQLLKLAKEKGVIFAVKVAQKMNDPYTLDMLHDKLAADGLYKHFLK